MQVLRRPTASVHGMPTSDVEGAMQALGLYNPEKIQLTGDAARGQTAAACYACHKIGDTGVDFGPNLTSYGQQQAAEIIIAAMATPSAAISHGYEGSTIKTTDGLTITGMILAKGDPVIIKCMGGQLQTVPQSRIASITQMTDSLMYHPSHLGLTAQTIADITAYLKKL